MLSSQKDVSNIIIIIIIIISLIMCFISIVDKRDNGHVESNNGHYDAIQ